MQYITHDDMMKIVGFFLENGYGDYGITVETEIPTKDMLDRLNEDFFYRYVKDKDEDIKPDYGDVVNVNMNGIKFRYKIKEENADEQ